MKEQTLETSDETLGVKCKVEKHNQTQNRIRFKNAIATIGDEVMVLNSEQYQQVIDNSKDADKYIAKINQLKDEIDNNDINALNNQIAAYEKQVDKLTKSNNAFKQWNDEYKAKNEDLEHKLDKYKQTIADKDATILRLKDENKTTSDNEDLQETIQQQKQTISDLKQMNDSIAKEKDKLEKQLEHSVDASEIENLQEQVATLTKESSDADASVEYWQSSFENLLEKGDELTNRNDELMKHNKDLQNKFDEVNNTNKLLNESLLATNTNFNETKQQLQSDFQKQEKELKETIEKYQSHIDELTEKYQSLLPLKENIAQKEHYKQIDELKDEIKAKENEISKLNNEIETKLASQKSDLLIEHTKEKAQLLVAYNQDINKIKLQYNNLAKDYNHLLNGVESLTRINTLMNGKHNEIKKNKEQIQLLEITSEQLPPSDENVLEFVPKDS